MALRTAFALVSALVLAAAGADVRARDIWAIAGGTVARIDSATGVLHSARHLPPVRALAPVSTARAWALTDDALLLVDQDFEPLVWVPLGPASPGGSRAIAGDPIGGGVWISQGQEVASYDAGGMPANRWAIDDAISSLAFAGPDAVYVASGSRVARFDAEGTLRARSDLPIATAHAPQLLVDTLGGLLWVVQEDSVSQLDAIAGLALRRRIEIAGAIVAASLDPFTGDLTLATTGQTLRVGRDASASESAGVSSAWNLLHGPWGVAVDVPMGVLPTLTLARRDAGSTGRERITLRLGAQCDGVICEPGPDYLRALRLEVVLGNGTLMDAVTAEAVSGRMESIVEIDAANPDARLQAEVLDAYGRVSEPLVVSRTAPEGGHEAPRPKANSPPTVSITAPVNNASFAAPATVVVTANAADSDGTVSKVEFLRNGTLAATDTSAPWSATLSGLAIGTYTLTAKATDNAGATTTSAAVSIQVKANVVPTVSLTAPLNNATYTAPATIVLTASATDSDGTISKVEFFRGGATKLATVTTPPYTYTWANVAAGAYALTAVATDDKAATKTSTVVNVNVNAPPTVALTAPAAGAVFVAPASIVVTATASDTDGTIAKVELYEGATRIFTGTAAPFTYTRTSAGPGAYSYTAKATDSKGAVTTSAARSVTVNANKLPAVAITAPLNNATYIAPASVPIAATATDSDGTIAKVEFYRDGVLLGSDTSSPFSYAWNGIAAGTYALTAKAIDDKGGVTVSAPVSVKVNANSLPTVTLTTPAAGAVFNSGVAIPMAATAVDADGSIAKVEFFGNGTFPLATVTKAPYTFSWTGAGTGVHSVWAQATDDKGGVATSVPFTITVNESPNVVIVVPPDYSVFRAPAAILVHVNAGDDAGVAKIEVLADGGVVGTGPGGFLYETTWTSAAIGNHTLTARVTDNQGATTTSDPIHISIVANESPHVQFLNLFDGSGYTGPVASIPVSLTAWDNDGTVAKVEVFANGRSLATFAQPPYDFTWDNVATGSYSVTAVATDDNGAFTASAPMTVKVIAPIINVIAPQDGTALITPVSIPLAVNVYEDGADVTQVEYLANGATVAWGNVPPWTAAWPNVAAGVYNITARAYDIWGTRVESAPVRVVVNANQVPSVVLEEPQAGAVFVTTGTTPIRLRAGVVDADGTVTQVRYVDTGGHLLGTASGPPWEAVWTPVVPKGSSDSVAIVAEAIDDRGGVGRSPAVLVYVVDDPAPQSTLLVPRVNRTYVQTPPATAVVVGNASASFQAPNNPRVDTLRQVDVLDGGSVVGTLAAPNSEGGDFAMTLRNLGPGTHALTLRATDSAGQATTSSVGTIEVAPANQRPTVVLTAPLPGSMYEQRDGGQFALNHVPMAVMASDADGSVAQVEYLADNVVVATATTPPFAATWDGAPNGEHTLVARVTDDRGAVSVSPPVRFSVALRLVPPYVALTAPAACGTLSNASPILIAADAVAVSSEIARVDFYVNGTYAGSTVAPPHQWYWANPVPGTFAIKATAVTTRGLSTSTPPLTIVVGGTNPPPNVTLTSPVTGQAFTAPATVALAATASDPGGAIAKVEYFTGSTLLATVTASPWSATWSNVAAGTYAITAKATDNQGATRTSAPATITVSAPAPSIAITSPAAGARYVQGAPVSMTAQATTPGQTIAKIEFLVDGALASTASFSPGLATGTATAVWNGATPGPHTLTARVVASTGVVLASSPVSIVVSDLKVTLVSPSANEGFIAPADVRIVASISSAVESITLVEFLADGAVIGTRAAEPYIYVWGGVAGGPHQIGVRARTASGLVAVASGASITVVTAPVVQLDGGIEGGAVTDDNVSIGGTIAAQANAAVVVNGVRAALDPQGKFFVDGVPLQPGINTVTVVVNSMDAAPVTKTFTVNRTGIQPFAVTLDPVDGLAPFDATLTITNRGAVPFHRIEIDSNDDGQPETTLTSLPGNEARLVYTISTPGVRTLRVTVFGTNGNVIYVAKRRVRAYGPDELGARIIGVYESMVSRLATGDVTGALRTFTGDAQPRYQEVFTALGTDLRSIAGQLGRFVDGVVTEQWAELTMLRDTPDGKQAFMIYLIRGGDGIWRQESM